MWWLVYHFLLKKTHPEIWHTVFITPAYTHTHTKNLTVVYQITWLQLCKMQDERQAELETYIFLLTYKSFSGLNK